MKYLLPVPATLVSYSKPSRQDVAFFYTDPLLGPHWDVSIYWDVLLGSTLRSAHLCQQSFISPLEADVHVANDLPEALAFLSYLSALLICIQSPFFYSFWVSDTVWSADSSTDSRGSLLDIVTRLHLRPTSELLGNRAQSLMIDSLVSNIKASWTLATFSQNYSIHLTGLPPCTSDCSWWSQAPIKDQWMNKQWVNPLNDSLNLLRHAEVRKTLIFIHYYL